MLHTEFRYYYDNYRRFLKEHADKFIVIKGKKVIGIYDSHPESYQETIKKEELGTFLIQHVLHKHENDKSSSVSRNSFFDRFYRHKKSGNQAAL